MKTQLTTRFAVLAAAAAAVLTLASPALATGVTGGFSAGSGYCWENANSGNGNEILATSPIISPAETSGIVGGGQLVGFAATLQRWNGSTWLANQYSPLYTKTAAWGFDDGNWFDTYRKTWGSGLTRFRITQTGFYRLRYDYYWFNSAEYVSGHTSSLSWGLRDDRQASVTTTGWRYVDWCQY